jgi:hypothetical protein
MKLTKERLVQIIKEEMEGEDVSQEELTTKQELSIKLVQLSKEIRNLKGLDSTEIAELDTIINRLIVLAEKGSVGSALRALNKRIPDGQ